MDDIVYYAGCEAHEYLEKINLLSQDDREEVMEIRESMYQDSSDE